VSTKPNGGGFKSGTIRLNVQQLFSNLIFTNIMAQLVETI
jgi:hypothetical protein